MPQIEGLTLQDFLTYARQRPQLLEYLPDERDWVHLDKRWLCDVLYTLDQEGIGEMIHKAEVVRKEHIEHARNLLVDMKPEFADALSKCISFSCKYYLTSLLIHIEHKGRSTALLKESSKRKRRHEEIEDVKEEEQRLKEDRQSFLKTFQRMRDENEKLKVKLPELQKCELLLQQLHGEGVIDEYGRPVQDHQE